MRIRLAVMLAALVVTPALAQVLQVQPIQRPIAVQPIQPVVVDNDVAEKVMTLEDAQKRIAKLQSDKRELNLQLSDSTAKLNEALATIDQWTKKGGSLVHAYCESDEVSRNSAGASPWYQRPKRQRTWASLARSSWRLGSPQTSERRNCSCHSR